MLETSVVALYDTGTVQTVGQNSDKSEYLANNYSKWIHRILLIYPSIFFNCPCVFVSKK